MAWKIGKITYPNGLIDYEITEGVLSSGFVQITPTVNDWINIGEYLFKDYKFIRARLQEFTFSSLNDADKRTVCIYQATDEATCKTILGNEYRQIRTEWAEQSKRCRERRFEDAITIFTDNVSLADRYAVLGYINSIPSLRYNYEQHGVEGTLDGNPIEGIINLVDATPESFYYTLGTDGITKIVKPEFASLGIFNDNGVIKSSNGIAVGAYSATGIRARTYKKPDNITVLTDAEKNTMCDQIIYNFRNGLHQQ